jgi:hypothetical protein
MTIPSVTDDLLAEIEAAARAATPGPWRVDQNNEGLHLRSYDGKSMMCNADYYPWVPGSCDFDYIAAANPANVLALIARIKELEEAQRWVSVDYMLPVAPAQDIVFESFPFLVTDGIRVAVCDMQRGHGGGKPWADWSNYGDMLPERITHWQPMPEPPQ